MTGIRPSADLRRLVRLQLGCVANVFINYNRRRTESTPITGTFADNHVNPSIAEKTFAKIRPRKGRLCVARSHDFANNNIMIICYLIYYLI